MKLHFILGGMCLLSLNLVAGQQRCSGEITKEQLIEVLWFNTSVVNEVYESLMLLEPGSEADKTGFLEEMAAGLTFWATASFGYIQNFCKPNTLEILTNCIDSYNMDHANSLEQKCSLIEGKVACINIGLKRCPSVMQCVFNPFIDLVDKTLCKAGCSLVQANVDIGRQLLFVDSQSIATSLQRGETLSQNTNTGQREKSTGFYAILFCLPLLFM